MRFTARGAAGPVALAVCALIAGAPVRAACLLGAGPTERPILLWRDKVRSMLLDAQFTALDALEAKSRDLSQRIEDGQQLRQAFMAGIGTSRTGRFPCAGSPSGDPERAALNRKMGDKVAEWMQAYPASRGARMAAALTVFEKGWIARGDAAVAKVPEEAWPVYKANVLAALQLLDAQDEATKQDPAWITERIDMAYLLEPRSAVERRLEQALARPTDYHGIYFVGANFYLPRWGGSDADVADFMQRILGPPPLTTEPYVVYARAGWSVSDPKMFVNHRVAWPAMKRGFEELLANYPHPWNVNNFAHFACLAGDWETVRNLTARIERPTTEAWQEVSYEDCQRAGQSRRGWGMLLPLAAILVLAILMLVRAAQLRRDVG